MKCALLLALALVGCAGPQLRPVTLEDALSDHTTPHTLLADSSPFTVSSPGVGCSSCALTGTTLTLSTGAFTSTVVSGSANGFDFNTTNALSSGSGDTLFRIRNGGGVVLGLTPGGTLLVGSGLTANAANTITIAGGPSNGAAAVGVAINSTNNLTTSGALLLSVRNNNVEKANVDKDGRIAKYGGTATAGIGVSPIYAYGSLTAVTAASTSITTYTPAAAGLFEVGGAINVTAFTSGALAVQIAYTDPGSVARSFNAFGATSAPGTGTTIAATGNLAVFPQVIAVKAGTAITVTAIDSGTATADFYGWIRQVGP